MVLRTVTEGNGLIREAMASQMGDELKGAPDSGIFFRRAAVCASRTAGASHPVLASGEERWKAGHLRRRAGSCRQRDLFRTQVGWVNLRIAP